MENIKDEIERAIEIVAKRYPAAEPDIRDAIAQAKGETTLRMHVAAMGVKERMQFLRRRYAKAAKWKDVRPEKMPSKPAEFKKWADAFQKWMDENYPDRRELGVVLGDLAHLDPEAHKRLRNMMHQWRADGTRTDPAIFGFPLRARRIPYRRPRLYRRVRKGRINYRLCR